MGVNVFADMPRLVPRISPEVVLRGRPQVILTGSPEGASDDQLDHWKTIPNYVRLLTTIYFCAHHNFSTNTRLLEASRDICQNWILPVAVDNFGRLSLTQAHTR